MTDRAHGCASDRAERSIRVVEKPRDVDDFQPHRHFCFLWLLGDSFSPQRRAGFLADDFYRNDAGHVYWLDRRPGDHPRAEKARHGAQELTLRKHTRGCFLKILEAAPRICRAD